MIIPSMSLITTLLLLICLLDTIPSVLSSSLVYSKQEMHNKETNVRILKVEEIDDYINSATPSFLLLTGKNCYECAPMDF